MDTCIWNEFSTIVRLTFLLWPTYKTTAEELLIFLVNCLCMIICYIYIQECLILIFFKKKDMQSYQQWHYVGRGLVLDCLDHKKFEPWTQKRTRLLYTSIEITLLFTQVKGQHLLWLFYLVLWTDCLILTVT